MKKIHKLKKWYSLDEAANRLTDSLSEPVKDSDLLELAIDGNIELFWFMRSTPAVEVEWKTKKLRTLSDTEEYIQVAGYYKNEEQETVASLKGPFILPLTEINSLSDYLKFTISDENDEDRYISIDGYNVKDNKGKIWNVLERFDDKKNRGVNITASKIIFHLPKSLKFQNSVLQERSWKELKLS